MTEDLPRDVLDGTHFSVPDTVDDRPAVIFGGSLSHFPAGGQVIQILLMDVGTGTGWSRGFSYQRSKASVSERDGGMQRQMCMSRQFQDWGGHHRA